LISKWLSNLAIGVMMNVHYMEEVNDYWTNVFARTLFAIDIIDTSSECTDM
jgi:hypothetical protein